jgi:hypothetical protein
MLLGNAVTSLRMVRYHGTTFYSPRFHSLVSHFSAVKGQSRGSQGAIHVSINLACNEIRASLVVLVRIFRKAFSLISGVSFGVLSARPPDLLRGSCPL